MPLRRLAVVSAALALLACPPKPTLSMDALIPPLGTVGTPYSVTFSASGGKGTVAFTSSGTLPPGLTLATSGTLSGTPSAAGQYSFSVTATDSVTSVSADFGIEVLARAPPSVVTASIDDGYAGLSYAFAFQAAGGTAPYTWDISAGALPAGLSLSGSGVVTGTPQAAGVSSLTARVTDSAGLTGERALALAVYEPLALETADLPDGVIGLPYSAGLVATGGKTPLTYSVTSGALPAGLALSGSTLAGTPTTAQSANFTIQVADQNGRTTSRAFTVTIWTGPTITTTSLPDAYATEAYSQALSATGGKPTLSWSMSSGSLPAGLSLSSGGTLSGTVGISASSQTFTVRATDSNGQYAEQALTLDVYRVPSVTTTSLPSGTVDQWYDQTLAASGGKPALSWSYTGAISPGLTLDGATGQLSGTPTTGGTWSFTAVVTDANGRAGTASLAVTIGSGTSIELPVATWNIEWFGHTANGPADDPLQLANVTGVIADAGVPLWGVEEIVSTTQFQAMLANLPGYSGFLADDPRVPGGTFYYSPTEQKVGVVYQTARVTPVDAQLILTADNYFFAGRPPLRVDFEVDGGGPLTLVVLHMKAGATSPDWSRRGDAGIVLKDYLDLNMPSDRVLVVGDFNDDVDQSIAAGYDTPYRPIIDDSAHYHFVTDYLSNAGFSSEVGWPDMIDHQLATDEMDAIQTGNPEVIRPDLWANPVASYGTTTSDHYPVMARYTFGSGGGTPDAGTPLLYLNEVLYDEPSDGGYQLYDYEFVEVRNAGDGPADLTGWQIWDALNGSGMGPGYMRHTFAAGTTLDPGKAIVVFGGAAAIPPGLTNAVAASTNTLSLHPSDSARLLTPLGVEQDVLTWTYNWGDGLSANRSPDGDPYGIWLPHTSVSPLLSSPGTRADGTSW